MNGKPEAYWHNVANVWTVHNGYSVREQLKAMGAIFDSMLKTWTVGPDQAAQLRALPINFRVPAIRAAFCHEPEMRGSFLESDVKRGYQNGGFCGNCDSRHNDPIRLTPILVPVGAVSVA